MADSQNQPETPVIELPPFQTDLTIYVPSETPDNAQPLEEKISKEDKIQQQAALMVHLALPSTDQLNTSSRSLDRKKKSPMFLHKKAKPNGSASQKDNWVGVDIEELAYKSSIPHWLMYSWMVRSKDVRGLDKKCQQAFSELLILKQFIVPCAICLSLPANQQDAMAKNFISLFLSVHSLIGKENTKDKKRDYIIGFLEALIGEEVQEAKTEATLFRSNNAISKAITFYANYVGKEFLNQMLQEPVQQVLQMGNMEVDPAKIQQQFEKSNQPFDQKSIEATQKENMKTLLKACQIFLDTVREGMQKNVPLGLKKLGFAIQRQVERKFNGNIEKKQQPEKAVTLDESALERLETSQNDILTISMNNSNYILLTLGSFFKQSSTLEPVSEIGEQPSCQRQVAVSGFLFLRIICPSIVTPEHILGKKSKTLITPQHRRSFILISKVLQNLANGVKFGLKEVFMTDANSFLESNEQNLNELCKKFVDLEADRVFWLSKEEETELSSKMIDAQGSQSSVASSLENATPPSPAALSKSHRNSSSSIHQVMTQSVETTLNLILTGLKANFEKIQQKLSTVYINEAMTYTVFGALSSILKRFDYMEKFYDTTLLQNGQILNLPPMEPNTPEKQEHWKEKKKELYENDYILLGGLEQVLMMNKCVLLKGLLHPSLTRPSPLLTAPDSDQLCRSIVQIVLPHSTLKTLQIIQWLLLLEQTEYNEKLKQTPDSNGWLKNLLVHSMGKNVLLNEVKDLLKNALSVKLILSFLFAQAKTFLKPLLGDILEEVANHSAQDYAGLEYQKLLTLPNLGTEEMAALKIPLENLLKITQRILNAVLENGKKLPPPIQQLIIFLYKAIKIQDDLLPGDKEKQPSVRRLLGCFLLYIFISTATAAPYYYSLMNTKEKEITGKKMEQHPNKTFVLISYLIRHLVHMELQLLNTKSDLFQKQEPPAQANDLPFEPLFENFRKSLDGWMTDILEMKEDFNDYTIPISSQQRAKSVLWIKQQLNPARIDVLKTLIDLQSIRANGNNNKISLAELNENQQPASATANQVLKLIGLRMETIRYKLIDRVKVVLTSFNKEQETKLLLDSVRKRISSPSPTLLTSTAFPESSDSLLLSNVPLSPSTPSHSFELERASAGGFLVMTNKARRGMPHFAIKDTFGKRKGPSESSKKASI